MKIAFTKMHGIGNSYIYLDLFRYDYNDNIFCELAKRWQMSIQALARMD